VLSFSSPRGGIPALLLHHARLSGKSAETFRQCEIASKSMQANKQALKLAHPVRQRRSRMPAGSYIVLSGPDRLSRSWNLFYLELKDSRRGRADKFFEIQIGHVLLCFPAEVQP
jgi:hypothetical protein